MFKSICLFIIFEFKICRSYHRSFITCQQCLEFVLYSFCYNVCNTLRMSNVSSAGRNLRTHCNGNWKNVQNESSSWDDKWFLFWFVCIKFLNFSYDYGFGFLRDDKCWICCNRSLVHKRSQKCKKKSFKSLEIYFMYTIFSEITFGSDRKWSCVQFWRWFFWEVCYHSRLKAW